jgi:hypothetical protein
VDNITAEILKTDMETTVKELHTLFNTIWTTAKTPNDWRRGLIIKLAKKGNLTICGNWHGFSHYNKLFRYSIAAHNLP